MMFFRSKTTTTHIASRHLMAGFVLFCIVSCADEPLHELGMRQVKEGAIEQGVDNLKKLSEKNPESAIYRADYLRERKRAISRLTMDASTAMTKGDWDAAEAIYQRMIAIDPLEDGAKIGLMLIGREKRHSNAIGEARSSVESASFNQAGKILAPVLIENPANVDAKTLAQEVEKNKLGTTSSLETPTIDESHRKAVSLQFRDANLKLIFEAISKASGINILLDKDIKADLKASIFVKEASVEDALSLLLMQNQLEKKVINDNTIYIYPATVAKLKDYQDLVVRVFQLSNADAKQMQTLLKGIFKIKDIYVNEKTNSIIIRDTPEVANLAAKLIASQDVSEPEVVLDIEVIEISLDRLAQLGLTYPTQVTLSAGAAAAAATTTGGAASAGGLSLYDLMHLNKSKINVLTPTGGINIAANLQAQDSDTNLLTSPSIRVKQHEKAKIHIGDRVPIITNTVTPVATGTPLVTGSVQYIDVGLKLEVEPDIHSDGEVGIKTSLEVSTISNTITNAASGSVAYQIGTRNANTVLKLKDGETQILAGLISNQEMKGVVKVPGVGDIPVLGRLFSNHSTDKKKTEIIMSITPHIVRNIQQPDADLSQYWSGTDSTMRTKPITADKMNVIKMDSSGGVINKSPPPALPGNSPQPFSLTPTGVPPLGKEGGANGVGGNLPTNPAPPPVNGVSGQVLAPNEQNIPPAANPAAQVEVPPVKAPPPNAQQFIPQNDLGSSGMSDAVLYNPRAK